MRPNQAVPALVHKCPDTVVPSEGDDALKDCGLRLRAIIDTVPEAIVIIDEMGLIESFSQAASRLFGFEPEQVTGRNVKLLLSQPYRDQYDDLLARYRSCGDKGVIGACRKVAGVHQNGTTFPIELSVGEAPSGGRRLLTVFVRDVSERQRVEAELCEAKATAEAANLAKSEFLSNMSHELRTPLNAILGFAQLMASDSPRPTPNQSESIDQILKAGWYLLSLIDEVLDLSLIESGKLKLSLEPVALAEVLSHCRTMIEPIAQKRGIIMTFPRFDSAYFVLADGMRLRQVFVNLLSNAIKYNRPNGQVSVGIDASREGCVRVSVGDTGIGLSQDRLVRLYEPFNRLGQECGSEQGTGIGLVVTKRLVEAMQATIGVESEVGVGTVFWVDLIPTGEARTQDCDEEFLPGGADAPSSSEPAPIRTILYVEDNRANLQLVERLIARQANLRLLAAPSAALGIELARAHLPDVILMDISLPDTDGTTAMTILRHDPATARIPIIAMTANANPRDVERGLAAGFQNYLTKPINLDELTEKLDLAMAVPASPRSAKAA